MSVSPEDIASVRQAQQQMMPEAVLVFKRMTVSDGRGGTKVTYQMLDDPIPGRVGRVQDTVRQAYASQLRGKSTAMLTVPVDNPLTEGDKVRVVGEVLNGTYIVAADLSHASFATAARFLIEENP